MTRVLAGRGFRHGAALACVAALALAILSGEGRQAMASPAASRVFSQVEPVAMTIDEFFEAAIGLDPNCAQARERLIAELAAASGASAWRPVVGFEASPITVESWAMLEGPWGVKGHLAYESGVLDSGQHAREAVWSGAVEAPLSCVSRLIRASAGTLAHVKVRVAESRVALAEARAIAAALQLLGEAESAALRDDATGAVRAYAELGLLVGLPFDEVRPVAIAGDGLARLAQLIERAVETDPAALLDQWLDRDPDLMEAEARLAEVGGADSLLDAITLSAGFEWSHRSARPGWRMGATLAVRPGVVGGSRGRMLCDQATLAERRADALRVRSIAEFARALDQLRSVAGDLGAAHPGVQRRFESVGIVFLARLGIFPSKP